MSCFICDDEHITALASFAAREGISTPTVDGDIRDAGGSLDNVTDRARAIAKTLHAANVRSVNARYNESEEPPFTFHQATFLTHFGAVALIKSAQCFEYQSCEHDNWEVSDAKKIIDGIIQAAIPKLPGWDSARWGAPQ